MSDYGLGKKDAETNFFLWMCRYDTSISSLRLWLKSQHYSKDYIDGYISYMEGQS